MLTSSSNWWKKTDCEVVKIKDLYVYPIFKNGSHELMRQKDKLIINNDIKNLKNIVSEEIIEWQDSMTLNNEGILILTTTNEN